MPAQPANVARGFSVAVLICKDLARTGRGLDLEALRSSLESVPDVAVEVLPGLCDDLGQIPPAVARLQAQRLVLGLCSGRYSQVELQSKAKKAGLDPFAAEAVPLGTLCSMVHARPQATLKARALLKGAVSKVAAFQGSGPDNTKLHFLPREQKVSRRALFTVPPVGYRPVPAIMEERCAAAAGCVLCARACPKGALQKSGGGVSLDKAKCGSCGVCLASCPREALDFPGWSNSQIRSQLSALLEEAALSPDPTGVLFTCERATDRLEALGRRGLEYSQWLPVALPCLAMVTPGQVLQALARGAQTVAFLSCDESCALGQAGIIQGRADFCRKLLPLLGQPPDRVSLLDSVDLGPLLQALQRGLAESGCRARPGVEKPFRLGSMADTLQAIRDLAGAQGALPGVSLEHAHSPFGVLELRGEGCTGCLACVAACPTGALCSEITGGGPGLAYVPSACSGCGICGESCPEAGQSVLGVRRVTDLGALSREKIVLHRKEAASCHACGAPIASHTMMQRIEALLQAGNQGPPTPLSRYCPACRMGAAWAGRPAPTH